MQALTEAPLWGVITLATVCGIPAAGCFVLMFWFIFKPGETDPSHPKYEILRHDR